MKKGFLSRLTFLVLALLIGGCAPISSKNNEIHMLNVNASGTVEMEPDIARVSIGVRSQDFNASDALLYNQKHAEAIMETLMGLGVAVEDIQTRNFSITTQKPSRVTNEGNDSAQTFVVDNTVNVTVRDLTLLGEILSAVVAEGANTIYGVTFDIEDKESAFEEARQIALADAQKQAEAIAEAAGVKLGAIHSIHITENNSAFSKVEAFAMEAPAGRGAVPISSGSLTIRVTVDLSYELD